MMNDDFSRMIRLDKTQLKPAAATLANAFRDYPVSVYFMPDAARRYRNQAGFRMGVRAGLKFGEVYATSPRMEGVAVWFPPDRRQETLWDRLVSGQFFKTLFTDKGFKERQRNYHEYTIAVRRRVVPGPHWHLQMLGVDPAYQGQGYSSRLLRPMLARAEKEGVPCYLETQLPKNVKLYEHFGFRVAEEGMIPGSEVRSWGMVRGK